MYVKTIDITNDFKLVMIDTQLVLQNDLGMIER